MVQPAFDIRYNDLANTPDDCQLLIEISGQAFNYILFTRLPAQLFLLRQYRLYTSDDKSTRDVLEEIISGDDMLMKYSSRALVLYNFPESNILPAELYNASIKTAANRLVYGDTDHHFIFDEQVHDWNMFNIYSVSKELHLLCKEKFRGSRFWHLYTMVLLSSSENKQLPGNYTRMLFYNDKFITAVFDKGNLQLLQTFAYQTPEDVAYYMLLICKQFELAPQEMALYLSGLIDTQSSLYSELLKYFVKVNYETIPESFGTNGLLDEYPSHYFSPLLKMSLCV